MHSDLEVDVAFGYIAFVVRVQAEVEAFHSFHDAGKFTVDCSFAVPVIKVDYDIRMGLQLDAIVDNAEGDVLSAHFVVFVHDDVVFIVRANGNRLSVDERPVVLAVVPVDFDDKVIDVVGSILQGLLPFKGPIRRRGHRTQTLRHLR